MNKENVILTVVYTALTFLVMTGVMITFFYFSKKKILKKELEKRDLRISHQKELLRSIILTQEEERARIAQDLHDDISSKLNIVSLNGHLLKEKSLSPEEADRIREAIVELTGKALENSRRIAHDLLPPVLEKFGLVAGIEELVQEFEASKRVGTSFTRRLSREPEDERTSLQVFRILQELMNNSLRHGNATKITIDLSEEKGRYSCHYADNGAGMDAQTLKNARGLGLRNIENRIEILEGTFHIESQPGQGVRVHFTF